MAEQSFNLESLISHMRLPDARDDYVVPKITARTMTAMGAAAAEATKLAKSLQPTIDIAGESLRIAYEDVIKEKAEQSKVLMPARQYKDFLIRACTELRYKPDIDSQVWAMVLDDINLVDDDTLAPSIEVITNKVEEVKQAIAEVEVLYQQGQPVMGTKYCYDAMQPKGFTTTFVNTPVTMKPNDSDDQLLWSWTFARDEDSFKSRMQLGNLMPGALTSADDVKEVCEKDINKISGRIVAGDEAVAALLEIYIEEKVHIGNGAGMQMRSHVYDVATALYQRIQMGASIEGAEEAVAEVRRSILERLVNPPHPLNKKTAEEAYREKLGISLADVENFRYQKAREALDKQHEQTLTSLNLSEERDVE